MAIELFGSGSDVEEDVGVLDGIGEGEHVTRDTLLERATHDF
jgi:hypothetical protein